MSSKSYVLVTGGSGGIGSAICRLSPSFGFRPIIGFHNNEAAATLIARETKGLAVQIDMGNIDSILNAVELINEKIGSSGNLKAVVLGASPPPALEPFLKISKEQLLHQLNVNLIGSNFLLQNLIKRFFKKNKTGTVIGILTQAMGLEDIPPSTGMGSYVIAKIALKGLLNLCSAEYNWLKIKTVSPGLTNTPMLDVFDKRYLEIAHSKSPIVSPEEVANKILKQIVS